MGHFVYSHTAYSSELPMTAELMQSCYSDCNLTNIDKMRTFFLRIRRAGKWCNIDVKM